MVSAQNITKKFGKFEVLKNLSFEISSSEFVFLTGPSGSGKTTLFRLLLRDLLPDTGSLVVDGIDLKKIKNHDIPKYRRQIGVVFQDFKVMNEKKVFENVSLPLEVRGLKQNDISNAVKLSLEMVGLKDKSNLFPLQLSGGEIQRVAMARAIVSRPKILLADEPTGNLDPETAKSILKLLIDVHKELKTTVIMATHNAQLVNDSSQRVLYLEDGSLISDIKDGKYAKKHH